MDKSGAVVAQLGGLRAVSRYQWLVFLVVWLGWTLDAADFGLYSLVLRPAMTELLGGNPSMADIGEYGGLLSMTGLLGWAFGGFLFGIIADYFGRVRTLAFSIAIYSVFTALQGLSQGVFDFAIYRFIAGLGTGAVGLRPHRRLWLALRILCRRRAGDHSRDHARPDAGAGPFFQCPGAPPRGCLRLAP